MTDNVVEFPKREGMSVLVQSDEEQENIETCLTLMHASLMAAANCGMQAGLTAEEYGEILDSVEILKDE